MRSQRRLAMVSWLVTVGVLGCGSGLIGAAPAMAEPGSGPGPHDGTTRARGGVQQSLDVPPPGSSRQARPPRPRAAGPAESGGGNAALSSAAARRVVGLPQLGLPADRIPLGLINPVSAAAPALPVDPTAPLPVAVIPASDLTMPVSSPPPVPMSAPARGVALPAHVPPVRAVRTPKNRLPVASATPRSGRVGLPGSVSEVGLPDAADLMPGVVFLGGLTVIGAFLGFRRARAGTAFTFAGSRFLQ